MARSAVFCTHIAVSHKFRPKCEGYRKNVGCCCLTAHFKRSTVSTEALRAKQVALGGVGASAESGVEEQCKILEVTTDCSTRWNSTLDMLDRLVKLRWAIGAVLSDPTFTARSHAFTDGWELVSGASTDSHSHATEAHYYIVLWTELSISLVRLPALVHYHQKH